MHRPEGREKGLVGKVHGPGGRGHGPQGRELGIDFVILIPDSSNEDKGLMHI